MSSSKRGFTRRDLFKWLGGVGLTIPLYPSLAHADTAPPKRFVAFYMPNGVATKDWFPTPGMSGMDTDFTLNLAHEALAPWRNAVLWTSGIDMKVAVTGNGEQHQRGIGGFLTGRPILAGSFVGNDGTTAGWAAGASLDQLLIPVLGSGSVAASLQLGVKCTEQDVSGVISYAGSAQPLLPQNDPVLVFNRLFGNVMMPPDAMEVLRRRRKSMLDGVREQLGLVRTQLSTKDRSNLDNHLTLVRELEMRVTAMPPGPGPNPTPTCSAPVKPSVVMPESPAKMGEVSKAQLDLLALALSCDLTRIATVTFSDAKNHTTMPHLNVFSDVHNITHMPDLDPSRADLLKRDKWQSEQLAYLLSKLAASPEGMGNVLDRTQILWGSDVSRGNVHAHDDMPFVLAGGGAGFKNGRFAQFAAKPHNNMLLSIFNGLGGNATTFGEPMFCTGPLAGL